MKEGPSLESLEYFIVFCLGAREWQQLFCETRNTEPADSGEQTGVVLYRPFGF